MKTNRIAFTALIITLLTITSKFVGFLRDVLIAAIYGATVASDSFIMSQSIIGVVSTIVISSLTVSFIPLLEEYKVNKTSDENKRFCNIVYTITFIMTGVIGLLTFLFSSTLVDFFAPGFSTEAKAITSKMLLVMTPTVVIGALVLLNNSYLQTRGRYYVPTLIAYPSNIVLIIYMCFFTSTFGIIGFGIAFSVGACLQLVFQYNSLRKIDFSFKPEIDLNNEGLKKLSSLVIPTLVGSGLWAINATVDKMVGSTLGQGSIAALNFSNRLILFVLGIVAASVTTVFYTTMSNHSAIGNKTEFKELLKNTITMLLIMVLPSTIGFIVLREAIVSVVFTRGAFDNNATIMTSNCLMFFSLGMIGFALRDVLTRSFYAIQDTISPMINGIIALIINIVLNLILSKYLGVGGLALATSISGIVGTILLMIVLSRKIGDYGIEVIVWNFLKIALSSILMGVVVSYVYKSLEVIGLSLLMRLLVSTLAGVISYSVFVYLFYVDEFVSMIKICVSKIKLVLKLQ